MTPERWNEIRSAFDALAALDFEARERTVESLAERDPALATELRELFSAEARDPERLRGPVSVPPGVATSDRSRRVGPWELVAPLGEGGMGRVFLARRADRAFEKQVAVKFIHPELLSEHLRARFGAERQALAALEHPGIARLLDGGETESGEPYLVLEYVEGRPLLAFAAERALDERARLELFLQVLAAVAYAHRHLVVHRDLKPANILVDESGQTKLLDFGIAKVLESNPSGEESGATRTAFRAMTPEYASPEQVLGGATTTATDVYALGMVLYELLTGARPFRVATGAPEEWAQATIAQAAARHPKLRGDLEAIARQALAKSPAQRYGTVDAFAEDLRSHLDGRPVDARQGSLAYRAGKFAGRHRAGVAAATAIVGVLLASTAIALRQARIAERERARAERRFADTRELARSLLFEIHEAVRDLDGATRARDLIVRRALDYFERLATEAGNDADLKRELAAGYEQVAEIQGGLIAGGSLGLVDAAVATMRRAIALRDALAASPDAEWRDRAALARSLERQADILLGAGRSAEGSVVAERGLAIAERMTAERPDDETALELLAGACFRVGSAGGSNELERSLSILERSVALRRQLLALDSENVRRRGRLAGALRALAARRPTMGAGEIALLREAVEIQEGLLKENPESVEVRNELIKSLILFGNALGDERPEASLPALERASALAATAVAADPANVNLKGLRLGIEGELARTRMLLGDFQGELRHLLQRVSEMEEMVRIDTASVPFFYATMAYGDLGAAHRRVALQAPRDSAERRQHLEAAREALRRARDAGQTRLTDADASSEFQTDLASAIRELEEVEIELAGR